MTTKCTIISDQRGSTLITVGMFVMALGMLSAAGLQMYNQYGQARKGNETQERLETLRDAMVTYFSQNGRFPCPAPLSAPMDDPTYGQESETPCGTGSGGSGGGTETETGGSGTGTSGTGPTASGTGPSITLTLGGNTATLGTGGLTTGTSNGILAVGVNLGGNNHGHHSGWGNSHGHHFGWGWPRPRGNGTGGGVDEDEDDTTGSGTGISNGTIVTPGAGSKKVRIGNVPTRAMNLPDTYGLDQWGNRIIYVVSEDMALPGATAVTSMGGITIEDLNGNSVSSSAGNIVLLLMSSGGDPRGTMDANGVVLQDCDTAVPAGKNCDADAVFTTSVNKIHDAGDDTFSHRLIYIGPDFLAE
jgi:type II secretory pathway pseudopilin PulG